MDPIVIVIMIGIFAGFAVGLQAPMINIIGTKLGILESAFIIHFSGAIGAILLLLTRGGGRLGEWQILPWYALLGGTLGVIAISAVSFTIPRISATTTVLLVVAGQLTIGLVLDQFGWLGLPMRVLDINRTIGLLALFVAIYFITR